MRHHLVCVVVSKSLFRSSHGVVKLKSVSEECHDIHASAIRPVSPAGRPAALTDAHDAARCGAEHQRSSTATDNRTNTPISTSLEHTRTDTDRYREL